MKADVTLANGGIGVQYSNLMLGGVNSIVDDGAKLPNSEYKNNYLRNGVYGTLDQNAN